MLAEFGGGDADAAGGLGEGDGQADHVGCAVLGVIEAGDVAVGLHLRVIGQVFHRVDDGVDEVAGGLVQNAQPLGAGARGEGGVQGGDAIAGVGGAGVHIGEARVGGELRQAHGGAKICPVAVALQHGQRQPGIVGAAVVIPQRIEGAAAKAAREGASGHQAHGKRQALQKGHGAEVRDIDFLPHAVALPRQQRGHNAVGEHGAAHLVGHAARNAERRHIRLARGVHNARARQAQVVERGRAALRPVGAVAGGAGVNEARVARAQAGVIQAQPRGHALAEVLHEDIGALCQLQHHLAGLGLLQIQRDGLLVAVVGLEIPVEVARMGRAARGGQPAPGVSGAALLNLDHLGAQVAEHGRADRALLPDGPVEDADAVEGHHPVSLPWARPDPQARPDDRRSQPARGRRGAGAGELSILGGPPKPLRGARWGGA